MLLASWSFSQLWNSPIEIFAVITGVICVGLITFENASRKLAWWNWPIGAASSAAFLFVFWDYELYFNSILQAFYVLSGVYGAWAWKRGGENRTELLVEKMHWGYTAFFASMALLGAVVLGNILFDVFGVETSQPFWDALVVTFSLTAQFVMTRKFFQHWYFWIAVDAIGIFLFWSQDLYLTSMLYFVYGSLCVRGLFTWNKAYKNKAFVEDKATLDPPSHVRIITP